MRAEGERHAGVVVDARLTRRRSAVLFLHGLGNDRRVWGPTLSSLPDDVGWIAADIPGFGASEDPDEWSSRATCARLLACVDELGVERLSVVGHSLGGIIALGMERLAPTRTASTVLVAAPPMTAMRALRQPRHAVRHPWITGNLITQITTALVPKPEPVMTRIWSSRLARQATLWPFVHDPGALSPEHLGRAMRGNSSRGVLQSLFLSTDGEASVTTSGASRMTIVRGESDLLFSAADAAEASARLDADLITLRACGHWPHVELPDHLARIITTASGHDD